MGIADGEVAAFGDMPNDVPMLLHAGRGAADGNACPTRRRISPTSSPPPTPMTVSRECSSIGGLSTWQRAAPSPQPHGHGTPAGRHQRGRARERRRCVT